MKLSKASFEKGREFVKTHARPLDVRLFEFFFEGGSEDAVLAELVKYQNPDGGFGHGIEADIRSPASSPISTSVGLQYAVAVHASADHQLVQYAIRYLLGTYDSAAEYWPANFKAVNDAPHAPWWHIEEIKPPDEADWPNPSAELVGYLHRYAPLVPPDFLEALNNDADAKRFFDGLSYSNKQRFVYSIEDARTAETRQRRIAKAISTLHGGRI